MPVAGARRESGSSPPRSSCSSTAASMGRRSAPSSARSASPPAPEASTGTSPPRTRSSSPRSSATRASTSTRCCGRLDELNRIEDPVEWLGRYYRMRLDALRRFEPVWRLIDGRGCAVPRAPQIVHRRTRARPVGPRLGRLADPGDRDGRARRATRTSRELDDGPYRDIPVDDFIDVARRPGRGTPACMPPTRKG